MRHPHPRGIALLFIVLIIGSISFSTLAILTRGSVNGFVDANNAHIARAVRANAFGCLDEVLIQLRKDGDFAPPTIVTGDAVCTLTVTSPGSNERLVVVSLTDQGYTRSVRATINIDTFTVSQVTEP